MGTAVQQGSTGGNVKAFFIDVNASNVDRPFFEVLLGDRAIEAALLKLNMTVLGGTTTNSRSLMDVMLQPLGLSAPISSQSTRSLMQTMTATSLANLSLTDSFGEQADGTWSLKR
mgnify:CR=1 FL=1